MIKITLFFVINTIALSQQNLSSSIGDTFVLFEIEIPTGDKIKITESVNGLAKINLNGDEFGFIPIVLDSVNQIIGLDILDLDGGDLKTIEKISFHDDKSAINPNFNPSLTIRLISVGAGVCPIK